MGAQAVRLGYLGIDVVDLDAQAAHYGEVIGLTRSESDGEAAWFGCGGERHALGLYKTGRRGYRHIGFEIAGDGPLDDVARALGELGIAATLKSDAVPGVPSLIEIADRDGYAIHLFRTSARERVPANGGGIHPDKLGHVAMFSRDPQGALDFYSQVLGFRFSDWLLDIFVFMRCNADHHALNFLKPPQPREGLFHLAFELRDWSHVGEACETLSRRGIPLIWGPGRHGTGHNYFTYHRDPDGNIIELFAGMDRMSSEALGYFDPQPHHRDLPQRPKVWSFEEAHLWGPPPPPDFWD